MKLLLFGQDGQVGWALQRALAPLGELVALGPESADFEDVTVLRRVVREVRPDAIINAAAYTAVDRAETEPERAHRINAEAVDVLAEEAQRLDAWLIHYSTDYVFDGTKPEPYVEDDPPGPLSVYGKTKWEGEQAIRERRGRHLIFRTSWVYAAQGSNFPKTMLKLAKTREELQVISDQRGAPTSAELIADVTALALYRIRLAPGVSHSIAGTYHLVASGETTWHEYARYVIERALARGAELKTRADRIAPIPTEAYPLPAARPKNSRLDTRKLRETLNIRLPHWRDQVGRLVDELTYQAAI